MKNPVSTEERANMVARYGRGQSVRDIGFALGRSSVTVSAELKAAGVQTRRRNATWVREHNTSGGKKFQRRETALRPFGRTG